MRQAFLVYPNSLFFTEHSISVTWFQLKNLFPYPVLWQDYLSTVPSRTPIIILLGICVGIPSMGQVNILPFVILESAV